MLIANPIYDVVFKRIMENERVVKFFIGTLLDENVVTVEVKPQEFTFIKDMDVDDPAARQYINQQLEERIKINVFRLDFIATIKTESGQYKKIMVEIQKGWNVVDIMRFRNYLAEQYKKTDIINGEKTVLPITTIYILGFNLPEIDSACIKVERNYKDLINGRMIYKKNDFIEKLTHDSFIVQVERITGRYQTRLDKLLSVFEQTNFDSESKVTKSFNYTPDLDELKIMTDILHHVGTDPDERKKIENEAEGWRTINALFQSKENELLGRIAEKDKVISEKDKAISELKKELERLRQNSK